MDKNRLWLTIRKEERSGPERAAIEASRTKLGSLNTRALAKYALAFHKSKDRRKRGSNADASAER